MGGRTSQSKLLNFTGIVAGGMVVENGTREEVTEGEIEPIGVDAGIIEGNKAPSSVEVDTGCDEVCTDGNWVGEMVIVWQAVSAHTSIGTKQRRFLIV